MKNITASFQIQKPFGNLYRKETVLIVVTDKEGRFVMGNKPKYYPEGITRLLGGGVDQEEKPIAAAVRELTEEVGIKASPSQLNHLADIAIDATTPDNRDFHTIVHIFSYRVESEEMVAGDDVADFKYLNEVGFRELINNFKSLPQSLWQTKDGEDFSWGDYGKIYGLVHEVALEEYLKGNK
jgi:8-oxo-dGTP pyrophosphatase MutT (NUDIX family)